MTAFTAELIGTMILVTLGDGVVANALLNHTKGHKSGWIVITAGWAFAVAVYCVGSVSGGHLNPVVTLGLALVGVLVWSIGLSLGGATGYAINPARDLGPRIAHAILPIAGKGGSGWGYGWIPVVGPIIGGTMGAFIYQWLWSASAPVMELPVVPSPRL